MTQKTFGQLRAEAKAEVDAQAEARRKLRESIDRALSRVAMPPEARVALARKLSALEEESEKLGWLMRVEDAYARAPAGGTVKDEWAKVDRGDGQ